MEDVEERALNSCSNPPKFWKRYVDDVCVAMKKDKINDFLSHLNSIELTIKFTVETEDDDNTLPFLDTRLYRMEDGIIQTSGYRSPRILTGIWPTCHTTQLSTRKRWFKHCAPEQSGCLPLLTKNYRRLSIFLMR